jgi:hypothetical protein
MSLNNKKVKIIFHPPTRAEYEHTLNQLFKRGYVFDANARCTNIVEVWRRWGHLESDYPFLAVYEGTNVTDSFSTLEQRERKLILPVPLVDTLPAFSV